MASEFKPHPYQQYCIDRIISQENIGLFLDMGLGKTVITLMAIKELKYYRLQVNRVLVIAPKKVAESTWLAEKERWTQTKVLRVEKVLGDAKERLVALQRQADIWVINRENVAWLVEQYRNAWPFDMVVLDESSSFKNRSAKRFKALAKVRPHIRRMVALTGTPSPNGLMDLWAQIYLLDGGERLEKRFIGFRDRYFDPGWRSSTGIVYQWKPKETAEKQILQRISDLCISMRSEDYLELPELVYQDIPVCLDQKASDTYRTMERDMVLSLDESEITATSAAALTGKLLQLANGAVYDADGSWHELHTCKLEMLQELIEQLHGQHALIFYQFQHDRERIVEVLKDRARLMKTDEDIQAWNRGEVELLLAHPASAGYGLNLQRGGRHVIWYGLTWNLELYQQANKRLHRQGQKDTVFVHHLIAEGTADEDVKQVLQRKATDQNYVMDVLKARIKKLKEAK